MASARPWRWLVLLTSGGLFGLAVVAAQASAGDDADTVEAIETPIPVRSVSVIPDADPSDIATPPPAPDDAEAPHEESFHAAGHTRAKRSRRTKRNANRRDYRFSASKSGILPAQIFEDDDSDQAPVQQQANAPRK